jgi:hypothetical protein
MDGQIVDGKMIMSGYCNGYIETWSDYQLVRIKKDGYDLRKSEMPLWMRGQYVPIEKSNAPASVKREILEDQKFKIPKEPFFLVSVFKSMILSIKEMIGLL